MSDNNTLAGILRDIAMLLTESRDLSTEDFRARANLLYLRIEAAYPAKKGA